MDTSSNKEEDKYEGMNLDYKPSTTDQPHPGQFINSDDETDTSEKVLDDYYKAKIDHKHPNFHMIWEIVKEERKVLRACIDLFSKSKLPYSSINYLLIKKVAGS